jgi:hypothetical protein
MASLKTKKLYQNTRRRVTYNLFPFFWANQVIRGCRWQLNFSASVDEQKLLDTQIFSDELLQLLKPVNVSGIRLGLLLVGGRREFEGSGGFGVYELDLHLVAQIKIRDQI